MTKVGADCEVGEIVLKHFLCIAKSPYTIKIAIVVQYALSCIYLLTWGFNLGFGFWAEPIM